MIFGINLWYLCQISLQIMLLPILIAGAIISFFAPKGGDYSREAIISDIVHWKSCPKYFVLPLNKKNNHIKETEHGLFKSSKFGSLINFLCQHPRRRHWSVLLDQTPLQPHPPDLPLCVSIAGYLWWWEGERLFEEGDYLKYFCQRGAIIRRRQLIEGRLLFDQIG